MYSVKKMLIAATVAVVITLVVARPQNEEPLGKPWPLSNVANKTMCPIEIIYDRNLHRVPRLIKQLKCAKSSNKICAETENKYGCCFHKHRVPKDTKDPKDVPFERKCVEIEDTVLVTYDHSPKEPQPLLVSVGCTCMLLEIKKTHEVR